MSFRQYEYVNYMTVINYVYDYILYNSRDRHKVGFHTINIYIVPIIVDLHNNTDRVDLLEVCSINARTKFIINYVSRV